MKKLIYILCSVLVVAIIANICFPSINSGKDLPKVVKADLLSQKEENYFLYFYYDECPLCMQLDPLIVEASKAGFPIYAVDMVDEANVSLWYDWTSHHEQYDVEIGTLLNGNEMLYEGINRDDYLGEEWSINPVDGKLMAVHNKAFINESPKSIEEIKIPGTPTFIHVHQGQVQSIAQGLIQCENMLNDFIKAGLTAFEEEDAPVESDLVLEVVQD